MSQVTLPVAGHTAYPVQEKVNQDLLPVEFLTEPGAFQSRGSHGLSLPLSGFHSYQVLLGQVSILLKNLQTLGRFHNCPLSQYSDGSSNRW